MVFAVEQGGGPGTRRSFSPADIAGEVALFEDALGELALRPPGGSEALTAFSAAACEDLYDTTGSFPAFREVTKRFLEDRPELDMGYKVQLFWRTFQYQLLNQPGYPEEYEVPEAWQDAFRSILEDPEKREELQEQLLIYNVQTTVPQRYAGLKLAIMAHAPLLPEQPTLVEAGSSAGIGQIQLRENIPFKGVVFKGSPEIRKNLAGKLLADLVLGKMVGFDQLMISDDTVKLIEAHSFYPSELKKAHAEETSKKGSGRQKSPNKKQLRDILYTHLTGIESLWVDLTKDDERLARVRQEAPGGQFDVAAALTTFYEIPQAERPQAEARWSAMARHLLVVQDYARVDPHDPASLVYDQDGAAKGNPYTLHTKYRDDPAVSWEETPWQRLGRWDSGRCHSFRPTVALANLCLAEVSRRAS